jgi:membrane protein DedA with SNARE-associated domain
MSLSALLTVYAEGAIRHWVFKLGGVGLVLVALVDNSVIPLPGSLDVAIILFTSGRHDLWYYYAFMATAGSVAGAYLTYRIGEKGGKETLERKIGKKRAEKVYQRFEKAGFTTILVSVLIPPPFPVVPVLLAAGVLRYPQKKFASAMAIGRGIRFTIDAMLGIYFGRAILGFFSQYYKPALYTLIGLAVLGAIAAFLYFRWWKPKHSVEHQDNEPQKKIA